MDPQGLQAGAPVLNATPRMPVSFGRLGGGLALSVFIATGAWGAGSAASAPTAASAVRALPAIVVYAPTPCLSCIDWADHMRQRGFEVRLSDVPHAEMPQLKRRLKVPEDVTSVLTAQVGPYFLEGPVPVDDVLELLRDRPKARGLAVPGTPRGAPGFESYNPVCDTACAILDNAEREPEVRREAFQTLLITPDGRTRIWARH